MWLMTAQVQAYQLSLMGGPRLERSGQNLPIERRKSVALLAYLGLNGEWRGASCGRLCFGRQPTTPKGARPSGARYLP
jgi:hypothetical protein